MGRGADGAETGLGRHALGLAVGLWLAVWLVFVVLWGGGLRDLSDSGMRVVTAVTGSTTGLVAVLVGGLRLARWRMSGSRREFMIAFAVIVFGALRTGFGTAANLVGTGQVRVTTVLAACALLVSIAVLMTPGEEDGVPLRRVAWPLAGTAAAAMVAVVLVPGVAETFAGSVPAERGGAAVFTTQAAVAAMWLLVARRFAKSAALTGERADLWCVLMFCGLAQARLALGLGAWFGPTWNLLSSVLRLEAVLLAAVGLQREMQRELVRSQLLAQRLMRERMHQESADEERRHDVRAAVFAIRGSAAALETYHDALEPGALATLARAVAAEAARLERLVSNGERQAVEPFEVDSVLAPLLATERARGQDVACTMWPDGARAVGRPDEIGEILRNLLDNARLHAPGAAVSVAVRVVDDRVLLTVADDGPGVPAADRGRVFERGARADVAVAGSGLGLYVAAKLAREQGGDLWLEDGPEGRGAAFTLCLPAAPAVAAVPAVAIERMGAA